MLRPTPRVALAVPYRKPKKERRRECRQGKRKGLRQQTKQRNFAKRKCRFLERFAAFESFIVHRAPTSTKGTMRPLPMPHRQARTG